MILIIYKQAASILARLRVGGGGRYAKLIETKDSPVRLLIMQYICCKYSARVALQLVDSYYLDLSQLLCLHSSMCVACPVKWALCMRFSIFFFFWAMKCAACPLCCVLRHVPE